MGISFTVSLWKEDQIFPLKSWRVHYLNVCCLWWVIRVASLRSHLYLCSAHATPDNFEALAQGTKKTNGAVSAVKHCGCDTPLPVPGLPRQV